MYMSKRGGNNYFYCYNIYFLCGSLAFEFRVLDQTKTVGKFSINVIFIAFRSWRLPCGNETPRFHNFISLNCRG